VGRLTGIGGRLALGNSERRSGTRIQDAAAGTEIRITEDVMPKAKGRKAAVKHLHKGKKLEATKPLRSGKAPSNQEFLKVSMNEVYVTGMTK
jgi:hypothetical protein